MEHYYCPSTNVCLRCFITRVEAHVVDPPSKCGQILPNDDIAEARKKKLIRDGLYHNPDDEPPTAAPTEP